MLGLGEDVPIYGTTKDSYWREKQKCDLIGPAEFQRDYPGFFCFSFVRNPFDRLLACYNNKIIENDFLSSSMEEMGLELKMPFDRFVDIVAETPDAKADVHLRSQAAMLTDKDGKPFPHFVGYLEKIGEDWKALAAEMTERGIEPFGGLPSKNVRRTGEKADIKTFYNEENRQKAFERYRSDFELFYPDVKA
jgi:extradiol dioxygenase family protein